MRGLSNGLATNSFFLLGKISTGFVVIVTIEHGVLSETWLQIYLRLDKLSYLIEFKHIIALNLNIIKKYNIIFVLLVNVTMYLNSI